MGDFSSAGRSTLRVLRGVCFVGYVFSGFLALSWYINWLEAYLMWHSPAIIFGFYTFPCFIIAALVEWFWHRFPHEITAAIVVNIAFLLMGTVSVTAMRRLKDE